MFTGLLSLTADELAELLAIRHRIDGLYAEIDAIVAAADARPNPPVSAKAPRPQQPLLREVLSRILRKHKGPMSVQAIYEATLVAGYRWRSGNPIEALKVKLYTDPTFKKVSPSHFVLSNS